ncbi:MAG: DUF192 domain-containing protein [Candidatus Eremiobacteraeota bacterium]|nr:DUF192 domain-containing protein [Candidatus Eremiobacteraeota bacterium]
MSLAALFAVTACSHGNATASSTASASAAPAAGPSYCTTLPIGTSFCEAVELDAPKARLRLAVANTEPLREQGLMGVRDVPPDQGMIFIFPDAMNVSRQFWMKDTLVPLDMVFVSAAGTITEVASNVPASTPDQSDATVAKRDGIGRYVIEVRAGGAGRAGLDPGKRLVIPPIDAR